MTAAIAKLDSVSMIGCEAARVSALLTESRRSFSIALRARALSVGSIA